MMKPVLTLLLFILPLYSLAQSNYKKGFVTDSNDHKQAGYIDYREWDANPKFIRFKKSLDEQAVQSLYPANIKSFTVDDLDHYVTFQGIITMNKTQLSDLDNMVDTTTEAGTIFLKQLKTGDKVSLYSYTDKIKTRFFVQDGTQIPYELKYQQYYNDNKSGTIAVNSYREQLYFLISKYRQSDDQLLRSLEKLEYDAGIEDVIDKINGTIKTKTVKTNTPGSRYFVGLGLNYTQSKIYTLDVFKQLASSYSEIIESTSTYYNLLPELNAGIDLFINPSVQKLIFRVEVKLNAGAQTFSRTPYGYNDGEAIKTITYTQYNGILNPQLIWNIYNKENFKFYINGGAGIRASKRTNNKVYVRGNAVNIDYDYPKADSWYYGFFSIQTGIVLNKRVEIFLSQMKITDGNYEFGYLANNNTLSAGIHLLLRK